MIKRFFLMFLAFAAFAGGIGYYKYAQIRTAMSTPYVPPPIAVTSIKATEEVWQSSMETVGSFSPVQGVTVSAEEPGKIVKLGFESGQKVNKDDLLVQLDVSVEEAQLKVAMAKTELAQANADRIRKMKGTGSVAGKEVDDAESQLKQATAEAESLNATIQRKTIRAPFSGTTGIRQAQLGQYLEAGDPVVSLQTLNPIYVNFALPQQDLSRIGIGQTVQVALDAYPNQKFEGKITAINPEVNDVSRTVGIQATFENKDSHLRPGMFARLAALEKKTDKFVTLPATAINRAPYGDSVYIIETMKDPSGKEFLGVRQQAVKVGAVRGDQIAVLEGLKEGEEVVTSGLFKLRPGASVTINNEVMPANSATPKPADS